MRTETRLDPTALYLGDNGRLFCGAARCAGMTASASGHDLSGQSVERVGPQEVAFLEDETGLPVQCEGCGLRASRVAA